MLRVIIACLVTLLPLTAGAATLTRTGALDVNLNGTLYDLEFVAGPCAIVFDGCDEESDFILDEAQARVAARTLLDLIDDTPDIDANLRINGCSELFALDVCIIYIPYASIRDIGLSSKLLGHTYVENWEAIDDDVDGHGANLCCLTTSRDTSRNESETFARWTLSSQRPQPGGVVPLPASALLLITALAGVAGSNRLKRRL